jgi:DUF2993 family protein
VRKILVSLVVLAVLLVGADFAARAYAESRVADRLRTSLRLADSPRVTFGGFPFLTQLAAGSLSSVSLAAGRLTAGGVAFSHVSLTVHAVRFDVGDLLAGRAAAIHADTGDGTAAMSAEDATRALGAGAQDVTVSFVGDHAVIHSPQLGDVRATVAVSGDTLRVRALDPADVLPPLTLSLPALVHGVRYRTARIADGQLLLSFDLDHPVLEVG